MGFHIFSDYNKLTSLNRSRVNLKKGKEFPVRKFHPWIFSGAIEGSTEGYQSGEILEVYSHDNQFLALGYWNGGGIAIKILSFYKCEVDETFWKEKVFIAGKYRKTLGLETDSSTNAYRLLNAEGDGVPGLIVDRYADNIVIQLQSLGLEKYLKEIIAALKATYPEVKNFILNTAVKSSVLEGSADKVSILECGRKFEVDLLNGQKTGFFLDQRENRELLSGYSRGKSVLNLFSYTGGFSIAALTSGAAEVTSVDSSKEAMEMLAQNLRLNEVQSGHVSVTGDVFDYLNTEKKKFNVVISDPPAFCKHRDAVENAVKAYISLNQQAMLKLSEGGLLFTFSCSQLVSRDRFKEAVLLAASRAGKHFKVVKELQSASCHPVSLSHPEGEYLKGLLLAEAY